MARIAYDPTSGLGNLLATGTDHILQGRYNLDRFLNALNSMTAEEAEAEIGIPQVNYNSVVTGLEAINTALSSPSINNLSLIDQG